MLAQHEKMTNSNNTKKKSWLSRKAGILFLIAFIATIISPYLVTQFSIWPYIDFTNTGPIGDTIGGITAPIINIFAAFLVYLAFKEQVKANDIQVQALDDERKLRKIDSAFNTTLTELNWCSNEYDQLEFGGVTGTMAIDELIRKKSQLSEPTWNIEVASMIQKLLGLKNYLNKMTTITKTIDSAEFRAILSNKILLIHRIKTRKFRSRMLDYSEEFQKVVNKTHDELTEMLTLDKGDTDWLENQKFSFHTGIFRNQIIK